MSESRGASVETARKREVGELGWRGKVEGPQISCGEANWKRNTHLSV